MCVCGRWCELGAEGQAMRAVEWKIGKVHEVYARRELRVKHVRLWVGGSVLVLCVLCGSVGAVLV